MAIKRSAVLRSPRSCSGMVPQRPYPLRPALNVLRHFKMFLWLKSWVYQSLFGVLCVLWLDFCFFSYFVLEFCFVVVWVFLKGHLSFWFHVPPGTPGIHDCSVWKLWWSSIKLAVRARSKYSVQGVHVSKHYPRYGPS